MNLDKFHQTTLAITTFPLQLGTGQYQKKLEPKEYSKILGLLVQKFNASTKIQFIYFKRQCEKILDYIPLKLLKTFLINCT